MSGEEKKGAAESKNGETPPMQGNGVAKTSQGEEGALPNVDLANAAQDPGKVEKSLPMPPLQEVQLEPVDYWELKSKRNEAIIAGERLASAEREFEAKRQVAADFEKQLSERLKLKVPITAYRLVDDGTKAILNLRPMPAGRPPQG
jgi:hypothetical protein